MIISKREFLSHTNLSEETLEIWMSQEWLLPGEMQSEAAFSDADIARAKLIKDLIDDLGVNQEGVGIILSLLDQLHSLRKAVSGKLQKGGD